MIGHSLGSVLMFDLLREKSSHMCSSVCSSINSYDRSQYYSVGDEIVEAVSSSSHYHDDGVGESGKLRCMQVLVRTEDIEETDVI